MKIKTETRIDLTDEKNQEIKYKLVGQLIPNKGHSVFELDLKTGKVRKAEFQKELTFNFSDKIHNKRILIKPNHMYCCALNIKNAMKHFKNGTVGNRISQS